MSTPSRLPDPYGHSGGANLADILERVLDKGIVIAGDIRINLLDIELLTIKLRLIVASVDRAKEMGIDWWEHDPTLTSRGRGEVSAVEEENRLLRQRISALEAGQDREPLDDREPVDDREDRRAGRSREPLRGVREDHRVKRSREPSRRERGD